MELKQVTIIGLGLIGGSFGMALKRTKPDLMVVGVDIERDTLETGVTVKAIDWGTTDIAEGVKEADVVILATVVSAIPSLLQQAKSYLKSGTIITDVGSTKGNLVAKISALLPKDIFYVGGHPMAGSEVRGIDGADPYLFENAVYVLTPVPETNEKALNLIKDLVQATGAKVLTMSPTEHDEVVAAISHLPHVTAAALVNAVARREEKLPGTFRLAAGGFRDATRIAESSPAMWRDIFLANQETLLHMLKLYRQSLGELEEAIQIGNGEKLFDLLAQAQKQRRQIPTKLKGLLPGIYEVIVTLPDRPGEIGKLAALLGIKGINIQDIEILRIREGDGGTIRVGFETAEEAAQAMETLQKNDYLTWLKH